MLRLLCVTLFGLLTACVVGDSGGEDAQSSAFGPTDASQRTFADAGPAVADTIMGADAVTSPADGVAGAETHQGAPPDVASPVPDTTSGADAAGPRPTQDTEIVEEVQGPPPTEDVSEGPADTTTEPTPLGGGILIFELASEFINQAGAGARFVDPVPPADPDPESVFGPCVVTTGDPDAPDPPPDFGYDAGEIVISGTSPTITLSPVDEGASGTGYASGLADDLESLLPSGGALLSISGAGGAHVPPFNMHVQVPEPVNLTSPSTGIFAGVSASSDLTVTWNAGTGQQVLVTLSPLSATFQLIAGPGLVCTEIGDPGTLQIPAAALGVLKNSGVGKVAIGVTRMRTSDTNAGDWIVPVAVTRSTGGPVGLD